MKPALAVLPLLVSCAAATPSPGADPPPAHAATPANTAMLGGWHWRLRTAVDRDGRRIDELLVRPQAPLQLDFAADRLSVTNACNRIGGAWRVDGDRLRTGPLAQTKRACVDPAVDRLDGAISRRLQGAPRIAVQAGAEPRLRLTTDAGDVLDFAGVATAETRHGGPGETVFLEVDARTRPCNSPVRRYAHCLHVRERRYDADGLVVGRPGEWMLLHHGIEGYTHEDGIRDVLRVKRHEVRDPGAGEPAEVYVLDMIVESERMTPID
jgi:heat shock protein HslJ